MEQGFEAQQYSNYGAQADCSGNAKVFKSGMRTVAVSCPSKVAYQETYQVPRTVRGTRTEQRTRIKYDTVSKQVPETKYRNETKIVTQTIQVPVSRQVPYTDYRTVTTTVPRNETYTV